MIRALGATLCLALGMSSGMAQADAPVEILSFSDLDGWYEDDHAAALVVFRESCTGIDAPGWSDLCGMSVSAADGRSFFESHFRPVLIGGGVPALFTGYFEPILAGSRMRTDRFRYALYRRPPELDDGQRWLSRREIMDSGKLEDRGLELVWLDDPVDVFFLQVQGSGRIRLTDDTVLRVGFGGRNGHPYRSIGADLVRRGLFTPEQMSAQAIRRWIAAHPDEGRELMLKNPSFVFFREIEELPPDQGPLGAMGRPVTPLRSVAVDPAHIPLGAPVWVEKDGPLPLRRLMVAQDTGSAIRGPQRADIFYGSGAEAGDIAGTIRDPGRMVVLLPAETVLARASEE